MSTEKETIYADEGMLDCDDIEMVRMSADSSAESSDAPATVESSRYRSAKNVFEARIVAATLETFGGNVTRAAEALGISRRNLHVKIRKHQIDVPSLRKHDPRRQDSTLDKMLALFEVAQS
jgi:DNA-binding NtrC family response regulator